jgi:hypothetical protein
MFLCELVSETCDGGRRAAWSFSCSPAGRRSFVRAALGRLSALSVFQCKSVFYGTFVWACRALNRQKRRFPARAVNTEDAAIGEIAAQQQALEKVVRFTGCDAEFFPGGFPDTARVLVERLLSIEPDARLGSSVGDPTGGWAAVRALAFFDGVDVGLSIFDSEAPTLGGGIVSAATAKEKNWNRRKQSMMWAPMPDQYSASDGAALALIPEESDEEADAARRLLAAVRGGTVTPASSHHALDDGTIAPIAEGEA